MITLPDFAGLTGGVINSAARLESQLSDANRGPHLGLQRETEKGIRKP